MKSRFRAYICLMIFVAGGLSLMVLGGKASQSIKTDSDSKPVVIEQYKFKPVNFEFKLLIY